ncbi:XrtA/PEP-CTERM system exopolysaccharide export protein [Halorhodospira halophila]|uniref:Polysaccharide export protein n=1 Tax=Halorhodospira halophila (strain DSM 244 / SL1) TaxID=349124 RepID=A1WX91_HALHL|nr:XrtA/PEP-CTERM system exopolysaccharide export protein [Halorhodospira halophila]ABM62303.1 polysaccharide export protein [Halorhodospira halophila SL1]MBK1729278.1 sugar ABC transporter substrate-binding protein [Halorhodospira halophila]
MEPARAATVAGSLIVAAILSLVVGCGAPPSAPSTVDDPEIEQYVIGPGDTLNVQVWNNPELSISVPVRPDGQISTPLVEDVQASGVTPTELARVMEDELSLYLRDPVVTVIVTGFAGPYDRQVRVIGQATEPRALQYREDMSVMDVMIEVGGMTDVAAGNRTVLVRHEDGERNQYRVRLHDLINRGEIEANIDIKPGDVLIIPERFF